MLGKIEHLGIAVSDLSEAAPLWEALLGTPPYQEETVASEGVRTLFFKAGTNKIELLEATHPDSPIAKFIAKRGQGIHHVAFDVTDIHAEVARLQAAGFEVLNPEPKAGADNKWVVFLHPKGTQGVLVELCQERG